MTDWMKPTHSLFTSVNPDERERHVWYLGRWYVAVKWLGTSARALMIQGPPGPETVMWANKAAR